MDGESDAKTSVKKSKKGGHKDGADGNAVFVRGLGTVATGEQLESFFSSVGPIRRSFVVTDGGTQPKCTGVGFVHFALREDAKKAIDFMQGAALGGRKLRLDFARRRLRAGDGPADGAEDADGGLRPKRARAHPGTRPPPAPVKGALSGSLGMRTVVVKSRDETQPLDEAAVLAMLGGDAESGFESVIVGATGDNARFVFQSWPHAGRAAAKIHGEQYDAFIDALRGGKKCKLIVRNLPFKVTQSEFRKVFTDIAPVREVSLPPPKDEKAKESLKAEDGKEVPVRCRGFGFVEYFLAADANRAITKLNGTKIGGRIVAVDLAIGKAAFILKTAEEEEEEAKEREAQEAEEKHAEEDTVKEEAEANDKEDAAPKPEPKRGKSTPEEMNRTVFIRNLLYETSATELWQAMEERFGPVEQAVIVKDPMTGRPRGTAFVRFASAEGVDAAITPSADSSSGKKTPATMNSSFSLQGRNLLIVRATNRERARDLVVDSSKKKEKNDTRNMRLAWIGHIKPDTPEARGMTEGDFAKRVKAEQDKRAKLSQNPNSFISETRLSVRNLPRFVDEKFLKQLFLASFRKNKETSKDGASKPKSFPKVTHTKVLRDPTRKDRSKGYGFIQFQEHRHALQALHKLNNNPGALEMLFKAKPKALALDDVKMSNYRKQWGGRRLIVEFSVEDKRQVAIIERVKEKGRAMKEAAILEKGDGDAKSRKSKKRKAPVGEKGQKRRKSDSEAQNTKSAKEDNINSVDSGKNKPQIGKSKEEVATDKGGSGPSKSPSDSGGKRRSKKRHVEETVNGNDEGAGRSKKKRRKKKKVEKDESDSKFDNMVAMYKKKLNKTAGQKWRVKKQPDTVDCESEMEPDVPSSSLSALIGRGDFSSAALHCEELQMQAAMRGAGHPLFAPHLFSLLILGRLPAARFLIMQRKALSPAPAAAEAAAIAVGEALWRRQAAAFYAAVRAFAWDAGMQPMVAALERATRERAFKLLATAYSRVHIAAVARELGVSERVARIECVTRGWAPDGADDAPYLRPPPTTLRNNLPLADPARKVAELADQLVRMQTFA